MVGHGGVEPIEVPHIVVVDEDVDELAEFAIVVEQAIGEAGVLRVEFGDHLGEGPRLDLDQLVAARHRAKGGGDANGDCHSAKDNRRGRDFIPHGSIGELGDTQRVSSRPRSHPLLGTVAVVKVVAAVDKFRGSATAAEVAAAIGHACWERNHDCVEVPMADGGEGLIDVLGGPNRTTRVTGPLGGPVDAPWRFHRGTAVIEMALASGLELAGGADGNDPMNATTAGTGELIDAALTAGAKRIIVGLGGSATTDGGLGALQALRSPTRLAGVDLEVACDVTTRFTDAARVFGPQKGASDAQVRMLTARLEQLADRYLEEFEIDVTEIEGTGAAGGIAGLLAALGGRLIPGFELVADELDLYDHVHGADLVITGEGHLDAQSFEGKVVGGVAQIAAGEGVAVAAVVGIADDDVAGRIRHIAIADEFGLERALREPQWCIERAAARLLDTTPNGTTPSETTPNGSTTP